MSKIRDTFFGGAEKKAGKAEKQALEAAQEFIAKQTDIARTESTRLFGGAQEAQRGGFQAALDIFGQSVPEQARLFGAGNVAAQQQQITGLPQIQAALLGQPVDFNVFQPTQLTPDLGFTQAQLPQTTPIADVITPPGTLSAPAQNIHPQAQRILDAFNKGNLDRGQALNRLLKGNAPGKGNNFPGIGASLANELLDFQGGQ
jgi:hypothetical protein